MSKMIYIIPVLFWCGVFLMLKRNSWGLKERAEQYTGLMFTSFKSSGPASQLKQLKRFGKRERYLQELSESLSYIRNITLLGRGSSISAVLLLEELSEFCPALSSTYLDMAHSLAVNEKDKAAEALYLKLNDPYALDIGSFLAGWEDIPQEDLLSSIDAYASSLRMERTTRLKRRDEAISDLIYFPVILNCMTVLMNFIYVAYFLEQREALMMLF
jgi:hypothetical protein